MSCHVCPGLSDEDLLLLDEVRATCHGGGAAVALHQMGEGSLNFNNMQQMLREASAKLVKVMENYGGYRRLVEIKEGK